MDHQWYFNDAFWQDFYECMFSAEHFDEAAGQIPQIFALLGYQPHTVLDLACGPGRHALALAAAGCQVTALDSSAYLLQRLALNLEAMQDQEITDRLIPLQQDMRGLDTQEAFDAVVCMWSSFGYFSSPDEDLTVLKNVYAALRPQGHFLLDIAGKEYVVRQVEPIMAREFSNGEILVEQPRIVDNCQRKENRWTLISGDKVSRLDWSCQLYSAKELTDLLISTGFSRVEIYGALDGSEYDYESERLIALAQK